MKVLNSYDLCCSYKRNSKHIYENGKTRLIIDMSDDKKCNEQEKADATWQEIEECSGQEKRECTCHKTKERSEKEYKDLIHRLNRIEGQVRGIKGMVEKDAYCTDILTQVAAVSAALNSFNKVLLANHIKTCVTQDIREGREDTVDELVATLQKLMK